MLAKGPSELFSKAKKDITPAIKKGYTKNDLLLHAKSLIDLNKQTGKVENLKKLIEKLIPRTNNILNNTIKNSSQNSIYYILKQELIFLNLILKDLDENNEISEETIETIEELGELATTELTIFENI